MLEHSAFRKVPMRPRYRSLTPPLIAILVLSAGGAGCETQASRERARLAEEGARRRAETEPPTQEVLGQVREAAADFMKERHADQQVEGWSFTALTPNLILVGVSVRDAAGAPAVRQLSAERVRDEEPSWFIGELKENGDLLWVIDDLDELKMKLLASRHGLEPEVEAIRGQDSGYTHVHSWGRRTWLDDYLLWHYLYHRPPAVSYTAGGGYQAQPMGYRFQDPSGARIQPEDARPYEAGPARTGGRSWVFLGGNAWRPPLSSSTTGSHGQGYRVNGGGGSARPGFFGSLFRGGSFSRGGSVSHGSSVSRGGFGSAGHAAGGHSGG